MEAVEVFASDEDAHAGGVFGLLLVDQVARELEDFERVVGANEGEAMDGAESLE